MEPVHVLREQQRLLAAEYGVGEPPPLDGEDLESADIADVEHWIDVYSELVELTRTLLASAATGPPGAGPPKPGQVPEDLRFLMLQAQVQELHLTYWVNLLNRLRSKSGPDANPPG